jgi:predicted permease
MLLWKVFSQVLLPILVLVGCGWVLDARRRLDLSTLVRLNIYLVVPAFIFHQVVTSSLSGGLALRVILFTATVIASMFAFSLCIGKWRGYDTGQTRALQLATMFYNSGNYGVPLMTLAFPGVGPLLQVFVVLTQNICTFTVGLALAASAHRSLLRTALPMLRQVSLWAVAAALLVRWLHLPVTEWRWFWVPVEYLHNALVGVALVTLGVQLSQTRPHEHRSRLSWALALRLLGGPIVAALLVHPFGFHGQQAVIMIVSAGFPTAVNTALIAHEFNADAEFAAASVFYSTLTSMISVTCLIGAFQIPELAALF